MTKGEIFSSSPAFEPDPFVGEESTSLSCLFPFKVGGIRRFVWLNRGWNVRYGRTSSCLVACLIC